MLPVSILKLNTRYTVSGMCHAQLRLLVVCQTVLEVKDANNRGRKNNNTDLQLRNVKYARIFNVRILRNKGLAKGCTK